jgi:hypothetical protein
MFNFKNTGYDIPFQRKILQTLEMLILMILYYYIIVIFSESNILIALC